VRVFDARLPDQPLAAWLQKVALSRGGTVEQHWTITYCREFSTEGEPGAAARDLCAVAYASSAGQFAEIWVRTGRIEIVETEVRWLPETPQFHGMRLHGSRASEPVEGLAALPELLGAHPETWPSADLSVHPEDVRVARAGDTVTVAAVVRNHGNAAVRGAHVMVALSTGADRGTERGFVIDLAAGDTREVEVVLPFSAAYGVIVVQVLQISEHTPHDSWNPDPTPDDGVAYRLVDPDRAPPGFAERITRECGAPLCRGF
jgi:hypothetical protein